MSVRFLTSISGFAASLVLLFCAQWSWARPVALKWKPLEGATAYELRIRDVDGKKVLGTKTKGAEWKGSLESGSYTYQVRNYDLAVGLGRWTENQAFTVGLQAPVVLTPKDGAVLEVAKDNGNTILSWKPVEGAVKYRVEIQKDKSKAHVRKIGITEVKLAGLAPGVYSWKIIPLQEDGDRSPASAGESETESHGSFTVTLPGARTPPVAVVTDRKKSLAAPEPISPQGVVPFGGLGSVRLSWKPVAGATAYVVQLFHGELSEATGRKPASKSAITTRVVQGTEALIMAPGEGSYIWRVRALAEVRKNGKAGIISPEASTPFTMGGDLAVLPPTAPAGGLSTQSSVTAPQPQPQFQPQLQPQAQPITLAAATPQPRPLPTLTAPAPIEAEPDSLLQPGSGNAALTLMLAPYDYGVVSQAANAKITASSKAITARASTEFWPWRHVGFGAAVENTSFTINGTDFGRFNAELQAKYRFSIGKGRDGWLFAPRLGVEGRQYFELVPGAGDGGLSKTIYNVLGGAVGLDIRKQLSERWSFGIRASYFMPLLLAGLGPEYSFGAADSYRNVIAGAQVVYAIHRNWSVAAGFLLDKRSIGVLNAGTQQTESVTVDGNYFYGSFVFNWGAGPN